MGIIKLHPYEYIYYNSFVGGVQGAASMYELDYWCTSGRDAIAYINGVAEYGSSVGIVGGPTSMVDSYARDDLVLMEITNLEDIDYIVGCKRAVRDIERFIDLPIISKVVVDEAVLAVIRGK